MKRKLILLFFTLTLLVFVFGCSNNADSKNDSSEEKTSNEQTAEEDNSNDVTSKEVSSEKPIKVVMEVDGGKKVEMELYPDVAPKTVANFVKLVNEGFYNGLTFHRVIPGFMIQGGDPTGTGTGGSDETIEGEFENNGYKNDLKHERGVISMARAADNNSASSQFFIMVEDTPSLDGDYAAFGKVISGMDEVDKIAGTETDSNDKPVTDQVIEKMYVIEE